MSVYEFKVKNIRGSEVSLADYAGKLLLIVNTASKCGFTPSTTGWRPFIKNIRTEAW